MDSETRYSHQLLLLLLLLLFLLPPSHEDEDPKQGFRPLLLDLVGWVQERMRRHGQTNLLSYDGGGPSLLGPHIDGCCWGTAVQTSGVRVRSKEEYNNHHDHNKDDDAAGAAVVVVEEEELLDEGKRRHCDYSRFDDLHSYPRCNYTL